MAISRGLAATAAIAVAALGAMASTEASAQTCRGIVTATGTGTGILGAGTAQARGRAVSAWELRARQLYGRRYDSWSKARNASIDCKGGIVVQARCVVRARACR